MRGLNANFTALVTRTGDTSGFILDPELNTYYVMQLSLLEVPELQTHLIALASELVPANAHTADVNAIHRFEALMQADLWHLGAAVESALQANVARSNELAFLRMRAQAAQATMRLIWRLLHSQFSPPTLPTLASVWQ